MPSEQQKSDYAWYKDALRDLYERYGSCFAVIRHEAVVDTFPTLDEAVDHAFAMYEPRTFIVQEIGPDARVYTMEIPTLWVVPRDTRSGHAEPYETEMPPKAAESSSA